jgi:hypothetical protein
MSEIERLDYRCWLKQFTDTPCDGRMDRAHLIPRQLMRRELKGRPDLPALLVDGRGWMPACRKHHSAFDTARTLRVPRYALPEAVERFAEGLGLLWWIEREFGEIEEAA